MAGSVMLGRVPLLLLAVAALAIGVLAGLARFGVSVPSVAAAQAGTHGALMIGAFLGTVIGLERAVALGASRRRWPFLAPLASGLAGVAIMAGFAPPVPQALLLVAGTILVAASGVVVRQQPAAHNATLALGAVAWLAGHVAWLAGGSILPAVPCWIAFLVLTIAGERLELTRFLPTPAGAKRAFVAIVLSLAAGLLLAFVQEAAGLALFAASLVALAAWLLRYDIARRTIRQSALPRYIAACLLAGYAWLAIGGLLGLAGGFVPGSALRDATLHAVLLGFVFSMIFGHAPIIFPAVAKIRIPYHVAFYLPLALLHVSLVVRVAGDVAAMPGLARAAAIANAAAIPLFLLTLAASAVRGRRSPS